MKNITIAGRIGKDAETRQTQKGDNVTNFTVAVDDRTSKDAPPYWFDCSLWGKRGDALAQYLTKGSTVTISGDLTRREHDGKTYLGVRANDVTLQGGKPVGGDSNGQSGGYDNQPSGGYGSAQGQSGGYGAGGDLEDDIPFAAEWRG